MNGKDLKKTALDINNRISVRYTMEDAEKELKIFDKLFGGSAQNLRDRHKMMSEYTINRLDLDN